MCNIVTEFYYTTDTTKQPKASKTHPKASQKAGTAEYIDNMSQIPTPCRTIPPPKVTTSHSTKQPASERHQNGHPHCCMHVHQAESQVCKPGEMLTLRKVKHPHNGRTSVNRFPLTKQEILSHYSGCFEGIGCFPGDPYKFHLKPDHKPARHAPRKVPVHLETAFKEEIDSLVRQGILEEVKEHTDWGKLLCNCRKRYWKCTCSKSHSHEEIEDMFGPQGLE